MRYRRALLVLVGRLKAESLEIVEALQPHWPQVVDAEPKTLAQRMELAASKFGGVDIQARALAKEAVQLTLGDVDDKLVKAIKDSIGVPIRGALTGHGPIAEAMRKASRENVALITSIPEQHLERVRKVIAEAFTEGTRWESVVDRVKRIGRITENRAKLIARDQVAKMTSDFSRVRQTDMGIKRYRWSGIMDSRERPSHRKLEGKVFRWDKPPLVDGEHVHPGQAVNCRCVPIAIVDLDDMEAAA